MLELIILGSVPGTDIHITYGQALIALLSVILVSMRQKEIKHALTHKQKKIEDASI